LWALVLGLLFAAGALGLEHHCPIDWIGRQAEIEEMLLTAEVVSVEDVGMGVTKPSKTILRKDGVEFAAAFKPIKRGRQAGFWESYEAEIAAYELDKLLGINMVPPTVTRSVDKKTGSLQYWVNDCKLYKEVQQQPPPEPTTWSHQLSTMKLFDVLINNIDRNAQNFLVDSNWHVVLIDHSRAFSSGNKMAKDEGKLPVQFDRNVVEKVRALDKDTLDTKIGELLMGGQVKGILERRDVLLEHLDELVAKQGEARVFFE
jgi:hypothetical protein